MPASGLQDHRVHALHREFRTERPAAGAGADHDDDAVVIQIIRRSHVVLPRGSEPVHVVEAAVDVAALGGRLALVAEDRPHLLVVVEAGDEVAAHLLDEGRRLALLEERDAVRLRLDGGVVAAVRAAAALSSSATPSSSISRSACVGRRRLVERVDGGGIELVLERSCG